MATNNQINKKLIYNLTVTHQNAAQVYAQTMQAATTQHERQQVKTIYKAIKGKELEQEAQR